MERDIKRLIKEVLEKGYLMSLGTVDEGGVWVSDVIYVFDDEFNLYWISDPDTRHSKAILRTSKVAGTITAVDRGDELGVQFEGTAQKIEGARYDLAKKHLAKRNNSEPKETDDVLQGDSWYGLKPVRIELIHKKFFGFEKQKLEF
ncbi:MAG: hypothetical protein A3C50_03405 [Candidatus Staskawiczbacteria bacterium RIFCSPHIGHO2_02_FULL_43_16]|uniref:Pyridoxamine 5'-phosphate oxidase N-terminal domain-containing protein n=1 Tax=Candidatus Staskawiczbacteria bacterium RIFCSPHIGHO2_01_FULL_41_41 TaxID=1802203 RepID=A0A1G2HS48_9BACT|nr:MAG: hypothetical protein A2822_02510 [Candidatus Staskawiczbacteria bacterium RIFCSPHIGHO2_01_FULL_41_41]OGZ67987.1 MAG: hypothetical protein A3C50_03405 [Candidatus Staskawiczbacteria bacterium RIFCSPHIGHO2_02_FULL_43_16]OGZ74552.1 MAG: hypothetical protein A3A12_02205 [Candidatus Staskawiczbacteria bacterium RIFCSPLOWO2_01_FULL_43_17b]